MPNLGFDKRKLGGFRPFAASRPFLKEGLERVKVSWRRRVTSNASLLRRGPLQDIPCPKNPARCCWVCFPNLVETLKGGHGHCTSENFKIYEPERSNQTTQSCKKSCLCKSSYAKQIPGLEITLKGLGSQLAITSATRRPALAPAWACSGSDLQ